MLIRQENKNDFNTVYALVKKAFETAEHADGSEQDLVVALRGSEAFVPELSLVAEIDNKIVGYILFTEGRVDSRTIVVVAPLAVLPAYQKMGVGGTLIKEGHRIAKAMGYDYANLLGSEKYYPRFGYVPAKQLGIQTPKGIPAENFMAIKLNEKAMPIKGILEYAKAFGV